jgi:predicted nucleotidyltransferase
MTAKLSIPQSVIADFCKRYHIAKLSLFGSVLREDFHADSDIDVLVEFEPGPERLSLLKRERKAAQGVQYS